MIKTIFFDVGGVLLTNGWDRHSRAKAVEVFDLDGADFERRHDMVKDGFETGGVTLDEYLDATVFYNGELGFGRHEFVAFMQVQSRPLPGSLELLAELADAGGPTLAALNHESRELNEYRIENPEQLRAELVERGCL